jgi:uncharacterized protein
MNDITRVLHGSKLVDLHTLSPHDIDLFVIVKHLCGIRRWCGIGIDVASHSLNVALHVPEGFKRTALMHDAAEAFIGDIPTPVKVTCPEIASLGRHVMEAIATKWNLIYPFPEEVVEADHKVILAEYEQLYPDNPCHWKLNHYITLSHFGDPYNSFIEAFERERR